MREKLDVGIHHHFEIDGAKFCFGNNPNYKLNEFAAKYRLMIFDFDLGGWRTINYPRNITEAKQMAKQYLIYS